MAEEQGERGIKSLNVTLDVLETIAAAPMELGVTEIAQALELTKPTVFRHLQTLVDRNYLVRNARTSRYRLGTQSMLLAQAADAQIDLRSAAEDMMIRLRDETGRSVVLSVVRSSGVKVLIMLQALAPVQIGVRPGSELPLHASAQGVVALAFGDHRLKTAAKRNPRVATTPYTVTDWNELLARIEHAREKGWADAPEQIALGLNAIAAPVFDVNGCVATLGLVGLIQDLPHEADPALVDRVIAAARHISTNLGHAA